MMELPVFLAFIGATALLAVTPGPNVALIVANSVAYGPRYGLLTVAGTAAATAVQLALTAIGINGLLNTMGSWFEWVRWAGVAYLLYLGVAQWRAAPVDLTRTKPQPKSRRAVFLHGSLTSLTNPKVLFFLGAFFPQFIDRDGDVGAQIALLCATFLAVAAAIDCGWAALAARLRGVLARHGRFRNRLSGGLLVGAGVGLAAVRDR